MRSPKVCEANYRIESLDSDGNLVVKGPASAEDACVFVLDLESVHPNGEFGYLFYIHVFPKVMVVDIRVLRLVICDVYSL
jgi:hypothetical protein